MLRGEEGISGPEPLIINFGYLVYGEDYDVLEKVHIVVEDGFVKEVGRGWCSDGLNYTDSIALPGILNTHIHFLDSVAPDACVGYDLSGYVGSKGLKHSIIRLYGDLDRYRCLFREVIGIYNGVGDFLEINTLCSFFKELAHEYHVIYRPLSRPTSYSDEYKVEKVAEACGGLGISNPLKLPPWILDTIARLSRRVVVAAHIGETKTMHRHGALEYLVSAGVKLAHVIHGIYMDPWEYELLAENDTVLVSCPSSNLWFTGRLPDLWSAWEKDVVITVGTDNTGCFKPDIWREINIIYSLLNSRNPYIEPREVLSKIIYGSIKALRINNIPWYIREGVRANIYIMDAEKTYINRSWNKIASIMKRSSIENMWARILGNKIIYLR